MKYPQVRSLIWRLGRKLYCAARRDLNNDPRINGEYWLLDQVLRSPRSPLTIFDIGANKGEWTRRAASLLREAKGGGNIHAFEPTESTFQYLHSAFDHDALVRTHKLALSNETGEREFFVVGQLEGRNSLYQSEGSHSEIIRVTSLDQFVVAENIDKIFLVKSDTEGNDFQVLQGAERALGDGKIEIWQFEYNHRWIYGRAFLKDVFDFIADKPYVLGKLFDGGIEAYDRWHPELDRFFECNYVLVRRESEYECLLSRTKFDESNVVMPLGEHK